MVLKIKFSGRIRPNQNPDYWLALFKNKNPIVDGCRFYFDPDCSDYDWLVVYEDLMYPKNSGKSLRVEKLRCNQANTLIVLQEPASIKRYGRRFLAQYGHVLSYQAPDSIKHSNHIWETTPVRWFYGRPLSTNDHNYVTVDQLRARQFPEKQALVSTVCSDKRMTKTLDARYRFTEFLSVELADLFVWYGRGIRPINDKSDAMDSFQYHLAVENEVAPHYWTDKISDSFLAMCLPIYYGHETIFDYFDPESFVPIDITRPREAAETIKQVVQDSYYTKRLKSIQHAREQVLTKYNLMNVVAKIVMERHQFGKQSKQRSVMGRHIFRRENRMDFFKDFAERNIGRY